MKHFAFVDVDGVLNRIDTKGNPCLEPDCIRELNLLCDEMGRDLVLVLCSAWRLFHPLTKNQRAFEQFGLRHKFQYETAEFRHHHILEQLYKNEFKADPNFFPPGHREIEIEFFLREAKELGLLEPDSRVVIIDDEAVEEHTLVNNLNMYEFYHRRFEKCSVRTDDRAGAFTAERRRKALNILYGEPFVYHMLDQTDNIYDKYEQAYRNLTQNTSYFYESIFQELIKETKLILTK